MALITCLFKDLYNYSVNEYIYTHIYTVFLIILALLFCGWSLFKVQSFKSYRMDYLFSLPHKNKAFDSIKASTAMLWVDKDLLG